MQRRIITIVYLAVGLVVASNNNYLGNLGDLSAVISALLAVILWPLVLLDIDLHIGGVPKVDIKKGLGPLTLPVFLSKDHGKRTRRPSKSEDSSSDEMGLLNRNRCECGLDDPHR